MTAAVESAALTPYYADETVTLYHGDCREILPALCHEIDAIVTDPPYGETSLEWDRWPDGWVAAAIGHGESLWCFGSMRMFLERRDDFRAAGWKFAQDIVWEKHNGSSFATDRFRRIHEHAAHFYRGSWSNMYHDVPTTSDATARSLRRKPLPAQWHGVRGPSEYHSVDGGPRMMLSVLHVRSMHGRAEHPTQKPLGILEPLITYSVPPGGTVLDPFAGSGSTLLAARTSGRRAVGIEVDERWCELSAQRLAQGVLEVPL